MDGVHDMGGMHGFGPVPHERDEPAFHHEWEGRVWGMMLASTAAPGATLDGARCNTERIPPALYLAYSYYERWLYSLTTRMLTSGFVTLEEVQGGHAAAGSTARVDAAGPETVDPYQVVDFRREVDVPPRFRVGQRVRTANPHPAGHTRLPRYARDKIGEVRLHHGAHVLPDTNAHGGGECPTHLYTVAFSSRALWGPEASPRDSVLLDVWECHLEAV